MSESTPLQSFAEDLVVFRQLTTPEERVEFSGLMKRAYAQQMSACAFVQRVPGRQVSPQIRNLCEAAVAQTPTPTCDATSASLGGAYEDGTNLRTQN